MNDKNGFELRVGDVVQNDDGRTVRTVAIIRDDRTFVPFEQPKGGEESGSHTELYWTILRRADGSVPERDAEGRPVLGETCDGCGKSAVLFPGATVNGKAGCCICSECAARCSYETKADGKTNRVFKKKCDAFATFHLFFGGVCGGCGLTEAQVDEDLKKEAAALAQAHEVHVNSTGDVLTLRKKRSARERATVFDSRIRAVIAEVAPNAPVTTDPVGPTDERGAGLLVTWGGYTGKVGGIFECVFPFEMCEEKVRLEFREMLWAWLGTVGAKAMGKR